MFNQQVPEDLVSLPGIPELAGPNCWSNFLEECGRPKFRGATPLGHDIIEFKMSMSDGTGAIMTGAVKIGRGFWLLYC